MKKIFMILALVAVAFSVNTTVNAQDTCHCKVGKYPQTPKKSSGSGYGLYGNNENTNNLVDSSKHTQSLNLNLPAPETASINWLGLIGTILVLGFVIGLILWLVRFLNSGGCVMQQERFPGNKTITKFKDNGGAFYQKTVTKNWSEKTYFEMGAPNDKTVELRKLEKEQP